jgi:tetratricopeptide (TPR) repeat protein
MLSMKILKTMMKLGLTGALAMFAAPAFAAPAPAPVGDSPATIHCLETVLSNPEEAMAEAQALYQGSNTVGARHCLGDALVAQGEAARGARILDQLAQEIAKNHSLAPDVEASIWGDAGRAWLEADDIDKSIGAFNTAVDKTPKDMRLRVDRAVALGNGRKYWEAIDDLNVAVSGGIDTGEAYLLRATAYREVGSPELALDDINRAVAKLPDDPGVLLERGRIRKLAKDIPGARQDFLTVMKMAPGSDAGTAAHDEMESLSDRKTR